MNWKTEKVNNNLFFVNETVNCSVFFVFPIIYPFKIALTGEYISFHIKCEYLPISGQGVELLCLKLLYLLHK